MDESKKTSKVVIAVIAITLVLGGLIGLYKYSAAPEKSAVQGESTPAPSPTPQPLIELAPPPPPAEPVQPSTPPPPAALDCPNGTYTNTYGNEVCRPYESPSVPAGATARCVDGSYSFSQSRRGTCSHHGGVAEWL